MDNKIIRFIKQKEFILIFFLLAFLAVNIFYLSHIRFAPHPPSIIKPTPVGPVTKTEALDSAKLEKYLTVESVLLGASDNMSYYFNDLTQDKQVSLDPARSWIPASTIKAFVVLEAFRQRRIGTIDFNQQVTVDAQNVVPTELETDEFPILREGTTATTGQLVEAMVVQSDNTAYNTLLDILDRRSITNTLHTLGLTETVVGEKLNLDENQFQTDLTVLGRQPNTTTVKDLASLFYLLYTKQVPDADEIISIFKRQKLNNMIPALLPSGTEIAHKTGDWAPIYHDGGIVYKPKNPFILAIFTNTNDPTVVSKLARVAYYRTSDVVDQNAPIERTKAQSTTNHLSSRIFITELPKPKQVLAVSTTNPTTTYYTVQSGDTLQSIADKFYHDPQRYIDITRRNYIANPSDLSAGTKLIIPSLQPQTPSGSDTKFPEITAADLGITAKDLTNISGPQVQEIHPAFITPSSPLYPFKRLTEQVRFAFATTNKEKIDLYLQFTKNRLSETKAMLLGKDSKQIDYLMAESESDLKKATTLVTPQNANQKALAIQQVRDLHYAVLSGSINSFAPTQKDKLIDSVYQFYKKNTQDIQPTIRRSVVVNTPQEQPNIGTIQAVNDNTITVRYNDGQVKDLAVDQLTKTRAFQQTSPDNAPQLTVGSKIAFVGNTLSNGTIAPSFILRDIPKDIPDKHEGVVLEIDPSKKVLEMIDSKGNNQKIIIDSNTIIRSRDTSVSIEGIKAGSTITVFGEIQSSSASAQLTQTASQSATPLASQSATTSSQSAGNSSVSPSPFQRITLLTPTQKAQIYNGPSLTPTPTFQLGNKSGAAQIPITSRPTGKLSVPTPKPSQPRAKTELRATSITVTNNASGAKEQIQPQPKTQSKPSNPNNSAATTSKSGNSKK